MDDDRSDEFDDDLNDDLNDDLDDEGPDDRPTCPACGAPMARIVYGYPGPELWNRVNRGEVVLGGCIVSFSDPTHQCPEGHQWMRADRRPDLDPDALAGMFVPSDEAGGPTPRVIDGWIALGPLADD